MSKEIMWSYAKWLIKNGLKDTISNFKIFQDINQMVRG